MNLGYFDNQRYEIKQIANAIIAIDLPEKITAKNSKNNNINLRNDFFIIAEIIKTELVI